MKTKKKAKPLSVNELGVELGVLRKVGDDYEITQAGTDQQDEVDSLLYSVVSDLVPEAYRKRNAETYTSVSQVELPVQFEWDMAWIAELRDYVLELLIELLKIKGQAERDRFEMHFHPYVEMIDMEAGGNDRLTPELAEWIHDQGLNLDEDKYGGLWLSTSNEMTNAEITDCAAIIWANPKVRSYVGERQVFVSIWSIDALEIRTLLKLHKELFAASWPGRKLTVKQMKELSEGENNA